MSGEADITPLDAEIGKNARRIRSGKKISQQEMAEVFESSVPFVSMLETGKRAWKTKWIWLFCEKTGAHPSELLGGMRAEPGDKELLDLIKKQIHYGERLKETQ